MKTTKKIIKIAEQFIKETRECISEIIAKNPKKIVLDLRNNIGGFIYVFYDSLLPLLPRIEDQKIMFGVDKFGNEVMNFANSGGNMVLTTTGIEAHKLSPVEKYSDCEIEVWVNSRSASSSEFIMILFAQEGYTIVGGPTMGLTTGMTCFELDNFLVSIPTYIFKDKKGKIYQPHDSKISIKKGQPNTKRDPGSILEQNILVGLPKKVIDCITKVPKIPALNNIISEHFDNNYHCSIHCEKPNIYHAMLDDQLYIYVPHNCVDRISTILDRYSDKVLSGFPVLVDIRGSKFGSDKENFLEIFAELYKPWKVGLIQTTHSQDDDYDRDFDKLEKKNLEGEYAYVANMPPYNFAVRRDETGKYSSINAKFWVNKFTIFGTISSCILLLYLKHNFGLKDEHKLHPYYNYSMHKYVKNNIETYVYTDKFES
jgi:hypothetical protein